jgi:hypothetical protein
MMGMEAIGFAARHMAQAERGQYPDVVSTLGMADSVTVAAF